MPVNERAHLPNPHDAVRLASGDERQAAAPREDAGEQEIQGLERGGALRTAGFGPPAKAQTTGASIRKESAEEVSLKSGAGPMEAGMDADELAGDEAKLAPASLESKASGRIEVPAGRAAQQLASTEVERNQTKDPTLASAAGDRPDRSLLQSESGYPPANMPRAVEAIGAKSGTSAGARPQAEAALRASHTANPSETSQHGVRAMQIQPSGAGQDASNIALARDPSGLRGAAATDVNSDGQTVASTAGSTGQGTFAALDADASASGTTWIHAGTHHAEAGFQDPALGWVGVRADLGGGGIHAALVPGTADAAQALGSHMAGLNAFLAERHSGVETLTLAAPESSGGDAGMNQGANQNLGQNAGQSGEAAPQRSAELDVAPHAKAASSEAHMHLAMPVGVVPVANPGAGHISVIA
jgi:hypothetical protein